MSEEYLAEDQSILDLDDLAPISVSVYTRLWHFQQCIESLAKNHLAKYSKLYVFSDAPKPGDEEGVRAVREYAEKITGFNEVVLKFQETNGYLKNMADAREIPLGEHGKIIRLEDDIVSAPGFLSFVNQALCFYRDDERVLNVTGYTPPIGLPEDYKEDFFVLPRTCAWGLGYYPRTLDVINKRVSSAVYDGLQDKRVLAATGIDMLGMIKKEMLGELTAGDIRCSFYQLVNNVYTIYPRESLVQNIGHDGTGVHCGVSDRFEHHALWDKMQGFRFNRDYALVDDIVRANYRFRSPSLLRRFKGKLRRLIKS